jgi:hypothetical protein
MDSWGRIMLIKTNRKALKYWIYYDYYIYDYLNKMFAASLLKLEDLPDDLKPPVKTVTDVSDNPVLPSGD